jgi:hypothetical protein
VSLERELAALARAIDVPEAPDLIARVRPALEPRRRRWERPRRRLALAIAVALVAVVGAVLAIPDARSALFRVLDIGSERIVRVEKLPEVDPPSGGLALGDEVSLAEARRRTPFRIRVLDGHRPPDRVYLGTRGTVWLLWGTPDEVRLLVAQSPDLAVGSPPLFEKLVAQGTNVELFSLDGRPAWFLSGEPHAVYLVDARGEVVEEVAWLAKNVLVWEADGVTFRLEGDVDAERALELARALR